MTQNSSGTVTGRNDPCTCGSGKKFKRCCGPPSEEQFRAPDLTIPKVDPNAAFAGLPPEALEGMPPSFQNPEFMMQAAQALQKLPRGQMQRLQTLMQKAMSGKDVSADAAELESMLPADFKTLIQGMAESGGVPGVSAPVAAVMDTQMSAEAPAAEMSIEAARKLVEEAMQDGSIPKEQAEDLLQAAASQGTKKPAKLGQFWNQIRGKK